MSEISSVIAGAVAAQLRAEKEVQRLRAFNEHLQGMWTIASGAWKDHAGEEESLRKRLAEAQREAHRLQQLGVKQTIELCDLRQQNDGLRAKIQACVKEMESGIIRCSE